MNLDGTWASEVEIFVTPDILKTLIFVYSFYIDEWNCLLSIFN